LTGRFLGGLFKDKNLEMHNAGAAKEAIDHDEITQEKEREGYYPNELDDEMKGYTYGDRLSPSWYGYGYGYGGGKNSGGVGNNNGYYNNGYYKDTASSYPYGHTWQDYWNN
jgi:hypothetical protein